MYPFLLTIRCSNGMECRPSVPNVVDFSNCILSIDFHEAGDQQSYLLSETWLLVNRSASGVFSYIGWSRDLDREFTVQASKRKRIFI